MRNTALLARSRSRRGDRWKLPKELGCSHDGTGDQLWKEGDEGREVEEVPSGWQLPSVHIDRVAQGLERVEADTDGQDQIDLDAIHVPAGRGQTLMNRRREKVEVLEQAEGAEVPGKTDRKKALPNRRTGLALEA